MSFGSHTLFYRFFNDKVNESASNIHLFHIGIIRLGKNEYNLIVNMASRHTLAHGLLGQMDDMLKK